MKHTNSLNKILTIFKSFADRSEILKTYGFGTTDQIGASKQIAYPLMWVYLNGAQYTDNGMCETYKFEISFLDKVMFGEDNYDDVLSDMQYVYRQFMGELMRHPFYVELEIQVLYNQVTSNTVYLALDDNVQGWTLNLYLKEPIRISYCNSPLIPICEPTPPPTSIGIGSWIIEDTFVVS